MMFFNFWGAGVGGYVHQTLNNKQGAWFFHIMQGEYFCTQVLSHFCIYFILFFLSCSLKVGMFCQNQLFCSFKTSEI